MKTSFIPKKAAVAIAKLIPTDAAYKDTGDDFLYDAAARPTPVPTSPTKEQH